MRAEFRTAAFICLILVGIAAGRPQASAPEIDPRVVEEVRWKAGYVNPIPPPQEFNSALLWGIAIADTRIPHYRSATVKVAWTQLSCVVNGKSVVLNDDQGGVRG